MSQGNVEIVRSSLRAFAEGNRDGARQMFAAMDETWKDVRLDQLEFIDGGDRVVVISQMTGMGRGSGVEVVRPVNGQVWTIREGRVVRLEFGFTERQEALQAAGLSE